MKFNKEYEVNNFNDIRKLHYEGIFVPNDIIERIIVNEYKSISDVNAKTIWEHCYNEHHDNMVTCIEYLEDYCDLIEKLK
jgi:hypothetical protein